MRRRLSKHYFPPENQRCLFRLIREWLGKWRWKKNRSTFCFFAVKFPKSFNDRDNQISFSLLVFRQWKIFDWIIFDCDWLLLSAKDEHVTRLFFHWIVSIPVLVENDALRSKSSFDIELFYVIGIISYHCCKCNVDFKTYSYTLTTWPNQKTIAATPWDSFDRYATISNKNQRSNIDIAYEILFTICLWIGV